MAAQWRAAAAAAEGRATRRLTNSWGVLMKLLVVVMAVFAAVAVGAGAGAGAGAVVSRREGGAAQR